MNETLEQPSTGKSQANVVSDYESVRGGGAGLIDLSSRARIEVSGTEAVQFLNGLVTNDVKALEDGATMLAAFPNAQGRLIAFARITRLGASFLIETEAATHEQVFKNLERFSLAGDFRVRDVTSETALISVQGARSSQIIETVLSKEAAQEVERGRALATTFNERSMTVIRATHTGEDGFDLIAEKSDADDLRDKLIRAGARAVGSDAFEVLRIEAGIPRYGVDMDESRVVLETGLDEAISFTKGCYIGQEIIARIHWRGHVAKRLAGLILEDAGRAQAGDKLFAAEDKEIGALTSVTFSPRLNRMIALAYIKYDYLAPGTKVHIISDGEEIAATVAELPFVRGSWYQEDVKGQKA